MAAPTTNLDRAQTVTVINPTPPTNVAVNYQGTPPTPRGLAPVQAVEPPLTGTLFADPLNGAVATQWSGTDAMPVNFELAGKAEGDGTEVTTTVGNVTGHSTNGNFTESPNKDHPSYGADLLPPVAGPTYGPELVVGGDFAAVGAWVLGSGWTISGGVLAFNGSGTSLTTSAPAATITAGDYKIELDLISNAQAAPIQVFVGGTAYSFVNTSTPGHLTATVTSAASEQVIKFRSIANAFSIDNVSVKQVL